MTTPPKTEKSPIERRMDVYYYTAKISMIATIPMVCAVPFTNPALMMNLIYAFVVVGMTSLALWMRLIFKTSDSNKKAV